MKILYLPSCGVRCDALRENLEALGHDVVLAGHAAWPRSGGENAWLVCLPPEHDRALPLIRELVAQQPELPIVACGTCADLGWVQTVLEAGAEDYILDPCGSPDTAIRLQTSLHRYWLRSSAGEQSRLEQRLRRAHHLESLKSLVGSVAHDFNNILSAVQGNAELALMDLTIEPSVRYSLEQIELASHRAAELTRQMLVYSGAAESGTGSVHLSLSQVVREMREILRVSVSRNARLEYRLGRALPLIVGDPVRLRQLVLGLVMNSSEAMGETGGAISVRTGVSDNSPAEVFLEVEDQGPGIPAPALPHLFDPFFSSKGDSRGLGLPAAAAIARAHGGRIEADPAAAAGARLRVTFPVAAGTQKHDDESLPDEAARPPVSVLLIDDDEAARVAARRLLRRSGYVVFEASSGEEGLDIFRQVAAALDVAIVDMNMPGLEAREVLSSIRAARPDLRLVVWSGLSEEIARKRLAGISGVAFIEKPAHLGEFVIRLARILAR
ncbi:MAG: response regulator [Candidatus Solibacter usitatus]|nr:response regulator [Candidatus Solibacter usitatus]